MRRFPWGGIVKLQEEMSELGVELAKLHAAPDGKHWDNKFKSQPLIQRVKDELGDVYAALDFFIESNFEPHDNQTIQNRRQYKLDKFRQWEAEEGMTGTKRITPKAHPADYSDVIPRDRRCGQCLACQDGADCFRIR